MKKPTNTLKEGLIVTSMFLGFAAFLSTLLIIVLCLVERLN